MKVNGFKLARIKAGLSQEEAAAKLRVSRVTVSSWECDLYKPSADTLLKISDMYGCTIDELLRGGLTK